MRFIYTKTFGVFFACLLVAFLLLFFNSIGRLIWLKKTILMAPKPVIFIIKNSTRPVVNFFSTLYRLRTISRENDQLRYKILNLQQQLADYDKTKKENESLVKELGLLRTSKHKLLPCQTLSEKVFGFSDVVAINCGSKDGVIEGQAVLSNGFLVGKIIQTEKSLSTVLLATSSKFLTDARLSKTNTPGVVNGSYNSGIFFDQLPLTASMEPGWLVVTAGINERIPKNIPIGEIGAIVSSENEFFKKSTLISPVNFGNLEFVLVVNN